MPLPPTPTPPHPTAAAAGARVVTITAADGATLVGERLGDGPTAVIFAVMGNCKPGWTKLAEAAADAGFAVLSYRWRACAGSRVDGRSIRMFVEDARAAIAAMRAEGAARIILVGASLGGCASARLLAESQADGLVVIAAPPAITDWGFTIEAAHLDSPAPKLFITAEDDPTVPAAETRALYELAAEPRKWSSYPGSAHGTDLLEGEGGAAVRQQILEFLQQVAAQ